MMRDLRRISLTLPLISTWARSLTSLEGAPYFLQGVDKCLFGFQGIYITDSGTKSWAMVTPESTAGTSEYTVLVASASSQQWTFNAGDKTTWRIGVLVWPKNGL
jgi:hypothetical protein